MSLTLSARLVGVEVTKEGHRCSFEVAPSVVASVEDLEIEVAGPLLWPIGTWLSLSLVELLQPRGEWVAND